MQGISCVYTEAMDLLIRQTFFGCCTEFVEGGFNEDSGKWRQDNSLCETTAPNSVKNGLVVACLVFALAVTIEWISCLLLMRCALVPSSDRKYNSQLLSMCMRCIIMVCVLCRETEESKKFSFKSLQLMCCKEVCHNILTCFVQQISRRRKGRGMKWQCMRQLMIHHTHKLPMRRSERSRGRKTFSSPPMKHMVLY